MSGTASSGILIDRIEHWAQRQPDATVVTFGDVSFTWSQWLERLRRLSGALAGAGIGAGDAVAFVDKNHLSCLEVTYAVSAIGGANAIPNWRLTGDELAYVLTDSRARIVFVGAELAGEVAAIRDRLPTVERIIIVGDEAAGGHSDEFEGWLAAAEPVGTAPDLVADATALLLYSSGTTGRPKGVRLTHDNLNAHSAAVAEVLPFHDGDVLLVAMPLFHVGGTCFAIIGLDSGKPAVFTREADAANLFGALMKGANIAFLVPPVIAAVLAAGEQAIAGFAALRRIIYGAAPMPLPLLRAALDAWPKTEFVQVYGMTELAGVITALLPDVHRDPAQEARMASGGTPLPGVEIRIVDPGTLEDVAPGEEGEMWWRSKQTTPGYWHRPEATADAIVDGGWLRSGDIGRADEGGFVYIVDRLKDMIITGGENVYSPEIERVLIEHPAVADVAIIGIPDAKWGEAIKAVVVLEPGVTATAAELIAYCREHLAKFKCPATVDFLDELPRNPTGKILKRTLRQPFWEGRPAQV
ncbi:long-chain-fatty-acid--CoA ligase [Tomitella biformata]|uniref:long-chain-fatty-acid--CoA ligase n=1 Tax=Tomitella biformata TaxID=630403 RepID=UPI000467E65A|nr:long-chain-fatty-acid--CoA ligase [Tomitella biformata]